MIKMKHNFDKAPELTPDPIFVAVGNTGSNTAAVMKKYQILKNDTKFADEWLKSCEIFNGLPNRCGIIQNSLEHISPPNVLGAIIASMLIFHLVRLDISVDSVGEKDLNNIINDLLANCKYVYEDSGDILSKGLG